MNCETCDFYDCPGWEGGAEECPMENQWDVERDDDRDWPEAKEEGESCDFGVKR